MRLHKVYREYAEHFDLCLRFICQLLVLSENLNGEERQERPEQSTVYWRNVTKRSWRHGLALRDFVINTICRLWAHYFALFKTLIFLLDCLQFAINILHNALCWKTCQPCRDYISFGDRMLWSNRIRVPHHWPLMNTILLLAILNSHTMHALIAATYFPKLFPPSLILIK